MRVYRDKRPVTEQRSRLCQPNKRNYFRLLFACDNALAATDLVFADVFGLLNSAEACFATLALVTRVLLDFAISCIPPVCATSRFSRGRASDFPVGHRLRYA